MASNIVIPLRNVTQDALLDLQEKYPDAEMQIATGGPKSNGLLREERFWELIETLDWSKESDNTAVIEPVVSTLANGPVRQIYDFEDILSQKLFALDGLKPARQIGESSYKPGEYFSPDVFLYTRCCAVANGKRTYEKVLQNPELMPKDMDFGALLRIAPEAYERKTGREWDYVPAYSIETYSNKAGWSDLDN